MNYVSVSFGMNNFPRSNSGQAYIDNVRSGQLIRYKEASEADAAAFQKYLIGDVGRNAPYIPGASECRSYSRSHYNEAHGKEGPPPARPVVRSPNTQPGMILSTMVAVGPIQPSTEQAKVGIRRSP